MVANTQTFAAYTFWGRASDTLRWRPIACLTAECLLYRPQAEPATGVCVPLCVVIDGVLPSWEWLFQGAGFTGRPQSYSTTAPTTADTPATRRANHTHSRKQPTTTAATPDTA